MHITILTPEQRADIEVKLKEAEDSYHSLVNGLQARVVVDQNGERVEFTAGNTARLAQYITRLQLQLAPSRCEMQRLIGPATFTF